jgi:hypothetical protein
MYTEIKIPLTWTKVSDLIGITDNTKYQLQNVAPESRQTVISEHPSIRYIESSSVPGEEEVGGEIPYRKSAIYVKSSDDLYVKALWGQPILIVTEI